MQYFVDVQSAGGDESRKSRVINTHTHAHTNRE